MDVTNNTTLHGYIHYMQRHSEPHHDRFDLARVKIYLIPATGMSTWQLVTMALGAQARRGQRIGLPWLKHFKNSQPMDLLFQWIPNPFPPFELLILRGDYHSETTWLLPPSYQATMNEKHHEFFDRVSLSYAEIEGLSVTPLYHYTHSTVSTSPASRNIGVMDNRPVPPIVANSLLASEYDTYVTQDAVTDAMCDEIGDIRRSFAHVDREWAEAHSDDSD
jgi:hypothetical protein